MTDQTTLADQVRAILDGWERIKEHADWDDIDNLVQDIRDLLHTSTPQTLADMTPDEQDECAGMQADLAQGDRVVILDGTPDAAGLVQVLEKSLDVYRAYPAEVTPRPDLPRMEWPGNEKPDPAPALPDGWRLADHPEYGRVIVTTENPDEYSLVAFVHRDDDLHRGHGSDWRDPAELTYIDQEVDQ